MTMTLRIHEAAHRRGVNDFASTSPDTGAWAYAYAITQSWGAGWLDAGEAGTIKTSYYGGLATEMEVFAPTAWTTMIGAVALYDGATVLWEMEGAVETAGDSMGTGVNEALLLAGHDTLVGNSWNNMLEGFAGNDFIDGRGGIDAAVFSGSIHSYTYWQEGGLIRTSGPDGSDTLLGVERLEFDDYGLAFDVLGAAGQAYRLYQAAFDRTPDIGGLGFQMDALDNGQGLVQVAGNFIRSPEFQARYGSLNSSLFVTQLYANVLDRAPDAGGLSYHVGRLNAGVSRAELLVGFSESPENQANVIGQIDGGMLYLTLY